MKPTYHLPPNFSTPPAPAGPFHLGTVIRNFDRREQMRPLNQSVESRIPITNDQIYHDHKGGFEANRSKLKSGSLGIWAKFLGLDGIGAEAAVSVERSDNDLYKFESVETEYFYPPSKYISQCMGISEVEDFLKGYNYKKPVYLVTGLKVARRVSVSSTKVRKLSSKVAVGLNNPGLGSSVGPGITGLLENSPTTSFTESGDIVVGIQCLKLYYKSSLFGGEKKLMDELHTAGATFVDDERGDDEEQRADNFTIGFEGDSGPSGYAYQTDFSADGAVEEHWVFPAA